MLLLKIDFTPLHVHNPISEHGLRTPNEGINQRYLKVRRDVADQICFARTERFGTWSEF